MRIIRSESATVAVLAATARAPKLAPVDPVTLAAARRAVRRARFRRVYRITGAIIGTALAALALPAMLHATAVAGPIVGAAVAVGMMILAGNAIMGVRR